MVIGARSPEYTQPKNPPRRDPFSPQRTPHQSTGAPTTRQALPCSFCYVTPMRGGRAFGDPPMGRKPGFEPYQATEKVATATPCNSSKTTPSSNRHDRRPCRAPGGNQSALCPDRTAQRHPAEPTSNRQECPYGGLALSSRWPRSRNIGTRCGICRFRAVAMAISRRDGSLARGPASESPKIAQMGIFLGCAPGVWGALAHASLRGERAARLTSPAEGRKNAVPDAARLYVNAAH
jgi:hypothetical protein